MVSIWCVAKVVAESGVESNADNDKLALDFGKSIDSVWDCMDSFFWDSNMCVSVVFVGVVVLGSI